MTANATAARHAAMPPRDRIAWLASIAFCGVLPTLAVVLLFVAAVGDDSIAIDFRPLHRAAETILSAGSPFPDDGATLTASGAPYVYPPLPALLAVPLTLLPVDAAGLLVMAVLVVVALSVPWVLGVCDWRCYGVFLLWPPVLSAIQTGNVTLWLALVAALVWRFRDNVSVAGVSTGLALAVKFLLWPLAIWLAATRRITAAATGLVVGVGLLVASWAVIGFDGMRAYPDLLQRLEDTVGDDAYTLANLVHDLGASDGIARAVWLGVGLGFLVGCVVIGRRGDERSAFVLALAAALALTPLVWLHYFALLGVAVAIVRRRLGVVWLVPLGMVFSPGSGDPVPLETMWTLAVAATTVALALRESRRMEPSA